MEAQLTPAPGRWLAVMSLACGIAAAVAVFDALRIERSARAVPEPVRVAVRAAARPVPVPVAQPAKEVLPLHGVVPSVLPKKQPPAQSPKPPAAPADAPSPPVPNTTPVLDLVQPGFGAPAPVDTPLPAIDTPPVEERPPQPPEDAFVSQYTDAPGGPVVVVAILVNHDGDVIDVKLVIPSRFPIKDMGLALAARQQKVNGLRPPLQVGEVRWIELRLEYPESNLKESLVP